MSTEVGVSSRRGFFLIVSLSLSIMFSAIQYLKGIPTIAGGPPLATAEVTRALVETGSIRPEYFYNAYQAALELSRSEQSEVWQDVFALDAGGELAPKHSLISSVFAAPLYAVFGMAGFWVFQQLCLLWLLCAVYSITSRIVGFGLPIETALVTCVMTPVLLFSYGFSVELHSCALLIGGFGIMQRRPFLGAFVMSLSVFIRPSHLLLILPLLLAMYDHTPHVLRVLMWRSTGILLGGALFLWFNNEMWGSPLTTVYGRLPGFKNGELLISPHPTGLDWGTLVNDWSAKLWGEKGVLPWTLCALVLPFIPLSIRYRRERRFQSVCLLTALLYTLYIFSYPMWMASEVGNRFLLSVTFLCVPPCVAWIAGVLHPSSPA